MTVRSRACEHMNTSQTRINRRRIYLDYKKTDVAKSEKIPERLWTHRSGKLYMYRCGGSLRFLSYYTYKTVATLSRLGNTGLEVRRINAFTDEQNMPKPIVLVLHRA